MNDLQRNIGNEKKAENHNMNSESSSSCSLSLPGDSSTISQQVRVSLVMSDSSTTTSLADDFNLPPVKAEKIINSPTSPMEEVQLRQTPSAYEDNVIPVSSSDIDTYQHDGEEEKSFQETTHSTGKDQAQEQQKEKRINSDTLNKTENGLNSISVNLFENSDAMTSQQSNGGKTQQVSNLEQQESKSESDSTHSHPLSENYSQNDSISDDESKHIFSIIASKNNHNEKNEEEEEGDDEEYEGGKYLLRHDIFLPSQQHLKSKAGQTSKASTSISLTKHQALFHNLDRSFEKNVSTTMSETITICSSQEMKDVIKMCFAAMAVVFSSHNPSVTTMVNGFSDHDPTHEEEEFGHNDDSIVKSQSMNHDLMSDNSQCNGVQPATDSNDQSDSSAVSSGTIPASNTVPPVSQSLSVISNASGTSDEERDRNSNNYENESVIDTFLNENTLTELIDNMEPVQRPSVPLVVVHMLWKQLIKYRFHDKKRAAVEKELETIMDQVQCALVEELGFLELSQYTSLSPSESNEDLHRNSQDDNDETSPNPMAIVCMQVNHDIHLQYGRYIAKDCAKFFPFYIGKGSDKPKHLLRIYDEDTWNAEEALNGAMAKSCLKMFKQYLSKYSGDDKGTEIDQLQFEYSIEMLPWHLMRALLYHDVVDLLTDYSFVKSRMNVLELKCATQMHMADTKELYSCIKNFIAKHPSVSMDIDIDQVLVESYRLVGGIIHSQDSNRWQDEDPEERKVIEKIDNESSTDIIHALFVTKALQAMGDSLSRYNLKSEAMKFYYRTMLKYEAINSALSNHGEKIDCDILQSESLTVSHGHVLMGGILSRIASVYEWEENTVDAMLCYERALSFYSRHQSKYHSTGVAKVLASMGQLHFNLKEFEPALSCLQESLAMWKSMEDDVADDIANLLLLMGHVRREMGQLNEALGLFSEAMYDKVNTYGKSHPEVGFIHQTIGVLYCDKGDYQKGLSHFEDALRIRESALESVLSHFSSKYNGANDRIQAREIETAECLQCIGRVYENCGELEESFSHFVGNVAIYRSHLLLAVSDQATIMVSDLVGLLKAESGESVEVSNCYKHLTQAIKVGKQIYPISTEIDHYDEDTEKMMEIESQIAEILYDLGLIEGAQYLYRIKNCESEAILKLEPLRSDAKTHFEQSIMIRKRIISRFKGLNIDDEDHLIDYEKITIAIISYELGKLFSCQEKNEEDNTLRRRRSLSSVGTSVAKEYAAAIAYLEDTREILEESIEMAETLDYVNNEDDCWISRLHKTPKLYEEMLQTMAVLYRQLDEYDKSVECYNRVSILLTRKELGDDNLESNAGDSMLSCQRDKVAFSSQSIGDILFDTGEYSRALKSYDEALQLRRVLESDSFIVADTLCLKGSVLLKLRKWDNAILAFDEAFRIRVDNLPQDHQDIAKCLHFIGKAYEGDEKLQRALEYFKKAQRIFSGHLVDTDTDAADLFFDLGNVVLLQDASSKHFHCDKPSEDDISLALTCLALCRDIYRRNFGADALEVGDVLNLLGVIYMQYKEYSKAISSFESALKIFHGAPLDQSLRVAKTLNNLSLTLILSDTDDYDTVFEYLDLANQTYEDKNACNIEAFAELMLNMGEANTKKNEISEAMRCYENALATYEVILGKDHVSISIPLEKMGSCFIKERRHQDAMNILEKALEIRKKHDRHQDLPSANIYFSMGIIHCETGLLHKAIDCYEEAIKIRTVELGNEDIQVAQILNNIGSVFARNREYQRALKPWQDAIDIYKNAGLNDDDPKVSCTMGNIEISKLFASATPIEHCIRNILSY